MTNNLFDPKQLAFSSDREHVATRGVKLKNSRSSIAEKTRKQEELENRFNNAADAYLKNKSKRQADGFELARKFLSSLNDKTLASNKGLLATDDESLVRTKLIELAIDLNNDEYEREGEGSIAIIQLLLKGILRMRDRVNDLEYKIQLLQEQIENVSSAAAAVEKK